MASYILWLDLATVYFRAAPRRLVRTPPSALARFLGLTAWSAAEVDTKHSVAFFLLGLCYLLKLHSLFLVLQEFSFQKYIVTRPYLQRPKEIPVRPRIRAQPEPLLFVPSPSTSDLLIRISTSLLEFCFDIPSGTLFSRSSRAPYLARSEAQTAVRTLRYLLSTPLSKPFSGS